MAAFRPGAETQATQSVRLVAAGAIPPRYRAFHPASIHPPRIRTRCLRLPHRTHSVRIRPSRRRHPRRPPGRKSGLGCGA
jgi:hypothetical protein